MNNHILKIIGICYAFLFSPLCYSEQVRIKDIASIKGNRTNHLLGMGLVVGLGGTGDSNASLTTGKSIANLISRLGIGTEAGQVPTQSVAVVVVTADLPAFSRNGTKIDVKISTIGDASSLAGGVLLPTRLKAGDGKVYVVASGSVLIGGANGVGAQTLTGATLPKAGMVEQEFTPDLIDKNILFLNLHKSDFTTSARVSEAINAHFRGYYASSIDPMTVRVELPPLYEGRFVEFISEAETIKIDKDNEAVVIINEKTGTIVMGAHVTISQIVISHGDLAIRVNGEENPKSKTAANLTATTVGDLLKSLSALGLRPPDFVGILQAIHAAGALGGKLKII